MSGYTPNQEKGKMRTTAEIDTPNWQDIFDRDDEIRRLRQVIAQNRLYLSHIPTNFKKDELLNVIESARSALNEALS